MVEKFIRSGIRHAVPRYAKDNNEHIKDHHNNRESSYPKYLGCK